MYVCIFVFCIQALCVHITSYMGHVTIALSVAKEIFPDAENICKYMTDALEEMKNKSDAQ